MATAGMILFDANETLFDLAPVEASVAKALDGGPEAAKLWFSTLLHHSLVQTVAGDRRDFAEVGAACLRMMAEARGIDLDDEAARQALAPMKALPPHPDVAPALTRLRSRGFRLAILTNSPTATIAAQVEAAGLAGAFQAVLSVEEFGVFKPHPDAYLGALRRLGVGPADAWLVAAHGWDVAGAKWAGLRAAFLARPGRAPYPLGPAPDLVAGSMADLAEALPSP